jgi:hypothetical protein
MGPAGSVRIVGCCQIDLVGSFLMLCVTLIGWLEGNVGDRSCSIRLNITRETIGVGWPEVEVIAKWLSELTAGDID